ncbi:MAG TPA: InlB B-repeat-containing protein [Clostridia bacterium]|nr:InlB B-repeat-containing protein [Clostridia bacterium]
MNKAKRFISIILAVTMVFSIVSVEFASVVAGSVAVAENGSAFVTAPPVVNISATKVARVAAAANSLLAGNTLVKATPSGVPDLGTATYANAAYAGETPVWPGVSFELPAGITLDAFPPLTITATTENGSVSMSSAIKNGQIYSANVTGGTATPGKNIVYTVSYYYEGANYLTYAYSYVESILMPSGIHYFYQPYDFGVTGQAGRMAVNYRYLGANVYSGEGTGGSHGYYDFSAGSFVDNPTSPHKVQFNISNTKGTKSQFNAGFKADGNRSQASVYIDTSSASPLADLNLRVSFFLFDNLSNYSTDNRLIGSFVQAGNVNSVSNDDSSSDPANDATALAQLGITGTSSVLVNKGDTITAAFNGPGPEVSGTSYTVTMKTQAPKGPDGKRTLAGYTSTCLTAYKYDKGALRQKINGILSGAAGGRSNPQSWYYSNPTIWDNFKALFDYANLILNKPNTDQATIDGALRYIEDAYSSLNESEITYTVNSYIQGTSTAIAPAVTASGKYSGYVLLAEAQTVAGYTLAPADASPAKITLSQTNRTINFYYTANPYVVSFQSNGGTTVNPITAGFNTNVTKPANPTKVNYTFAGWFLDEACSQAVSWPLRMPLNGTTLYAGWNLVPTTLTFNSNNGTAVAPVTVTPGTAISMPTAPTRDNYGFDGWYYDIAFTQPVSWPIVLSFTNITVYAKWTINQYTIHYDSNGGTSLSSVTVIPNTAVNLPSQPEKIGYTFSGWYYDNNSFLNPVSWPIVVSNSGYMLYAKWTPKNITITFNTSGGSAVAPLTALADSSISAPAAPKKFGYVFEGWTLGGSPFVFSKMPVQNTTLVANWSASERAVRVNLNTYKTVNDELVPVTVAEAGDIITVELSSKTNFYCGSSRFVIMYDSDFFQVLGMNKAAIIPNAGNPYYANAVSGYSALTTSSLSEWPATFTNGESSKYRFVGTIFTANNQALNGGFPLIMNDDIWLFRIRLRVKNDAQGSGHIFMDSRWDRSTSYPGGGQYYYYCPDSTTPSFNGQAVLDFDTDYSNANENIQLDVPAFSNIHFNTSGGSPVATISGEVGSVTTLPAPPTREGHTFLGWTPAFPATFGENDVTLTARWRANTYFASFLVDGNSYAYVPTQYGALISAPANPVKPGKTFAGWSPTVGVMGAGDKTFVALFSNNSYNANFLVDGDLYEQVVTEYDAQIQVPAAPQKAGYTFIGWDFIPQTMPNNNINVNATFSKNTYNAIFMVDGEEYEVVATEFGETVSLPQPPSKIGYTFFKWEDLPDQMPDTDVEITAIWSVKSYNSVFFADGVEHAVVATPYGAQIQLPSSPTKDGLYFGGWSPMVPAIMPANTLEFTALWVSQAYDAIFMVDGVEYARVLTGLNAPIDLPTPPEKVGFVFLRWENLPSAMPAQDVVLTAKWRPEGSSVVSFNLNGGTGTVPSDFVGTQGDQVTLPEQANIARQHYNFLGWAQTFDATVGLTSFEISSEYTVLYAVWNRVPVILDAKVGSTAVIDQNNDLIYGLAQGITIAELNDSFVQVNGNGMLRRAQEDIGNLGTGSIVELVDNVTNDVLKTYQIVIFGDLDGDGYVTNADRDILVMAASYQVEFAAGSAFEHAADLTRDGCIDAFDLNILKAALYGLGSIDQSNPGNLL